jgi:hypothetical protein
MVRKMGGAGPAAILATRRHVAGETRLRETLNEIAIETLRLDVAAVDLNRATGDCAA